MHHVAGHHGLLAPRANIDAAMAWRMARRRRQGKAVVELKSIVDEQRLSRLHDRPAIIAPRVPRLAPLENARRQELTRSLPPPNGRTRLCEICTSRSESRRPSAIAKHRIPAAMVEMQMRAKDVRDVLEAQGRRAEIVEPGLLGEVIGDRIALVLAGASINQYRMPRRAHEERLVGDHHPAAYGIRTRWGRVQRDAGARSLDRRLGTYTLACAKDRRAQ